MPNILKTIEEEELEQLLFVKEKSLIIQGIILCDTKEELMDYILDIKSIYITPRLVIN